ncbi:MAG: conjugal transfer protein TraX [Lachnospiraceae bacterium]|nr:conjugal transfer protein TraX [Lachnospiraceae bacterium]
MQPDSKAFLNRTAIKYIAVISMVIDHIAWLFLEQGTLSANILHFFGRLSAPTMLYFLVRGYIHTSSRQKYMLRLFIFALISWGPYYMYYNFVFGENAGILRDTGNINGGGIFNIADIFNVSNIFNGADIFHFGMIFSLFTGVLSLYCYDLYISHKSGLFYFILEIIALSLLSNLGDWGIISVMLPLLLYIFKDNKKLEITVFIGCLAVYVIIDFILARDIAHELYVLGVFLAPAMIYTLYNGESGNGEGKVRIFRRYFFYVFYPLHFLILLFLNAQF